MSGAGSAFDQAMDVFVDDKIGSVSLEQYYELTKDDEFAQLVTEETVKSFAERGLLHHLVTYKLPVYREFFDTPTFPCILVHPSLDDIEAIEDPERRAEAIEHLDIRATGERTRNLILSVDGTCWKGIAIQGNLYPPVHRPKPRRTPARRRNERDPFASNLWELFKTEDTNGNS